MLVTLVRLRLQRAFTISHFGCSHCHCVRQALRVYRNMTFETRDLLARLNSPCSLPYPCSSRPAHPRSTASAVRCAPVLSAPRQLGFFKARSRMLLPFWSGSLHLAKYECTMRHLGKSLGRNLHWQPVRSRYSTAHNTSYWSTVVGLVRRRTLQ